MTPKQQRLIKDIAGLFIKYDSKDWSAISELLTSDAAGVRSDLRHLIVELSTKADIVRNTSGPVKKKQPSKVRGSRTKPITKRLQTLRSELVAKNAFGTPSELRHFAVSLGIKEALKPQRSEAIEQIILFLASKPDTRVRDLLKSAKPAPHSKSDYDNEFSRWAAVILHGDNQSKSDL